MKSASTIRLFAIHVAALLLVIHTPLAAQIIWDGSTDNTWDNPTNWQGGGLPTATNLVQFNSGSTHYPETLNGDQTIAGIIFNNSSPLSIGMDEAYILTITHQTSPAVSVNGSSAVEILSNLRITGSNAQTWNNSSGSSLSATGNFILQSNLILSGSSNSSYVLGSIGKTLTNSTANRTITVQSTGAAAELTIDADIVLSEHTTTARTLSFDVANNTAVVINGNTSNGSSNSSSLRVLGTGDVTFNGNVAHTGYTSVEGGGNLFFNGGYTGNELRIVNGTATFTTSSATIRGLQFGSTTSATNATLNLAPGFHLTLTGDIIVNNTTAPVVLDPALITINSSRIINVVKDNTLTITSDITGVGARIHKHGEGTLILQGNATYDGANNALTAGTLMLDFTHDTGAKLSTQDLSIYNSTLILKGNAGSDVTQNLKNLRIAYSEQYFVANSDVILESVGGNNVTLNIQSLVRDNSVGNTGTIHFVIPENTAVTTTLSNHAIISGWATLNDGHEDHFIAVEDGKFVAATSTISNDEISRAWAPTLVNANVTDAAGYTGTSDDMKISSLRFTSSNPIQVVNQLHIETGGILVTEDSTATGIFGGVLTVGDTNDELIVHQNSATAFEISSNIRNSKDFATEGVTITKSGTGELILSGSNVTSAINARFSSSGKLNIHEGTVTLASRDAISSKTLINLNTYSNATLKLLADVTTSSITGTTSRSTIDLGSHTLTINQSGSTQYNGAIIGSGTIIKQSLDPLSSNSWTLNGTDNDSFTGHLIVNSGNVILTGNGVRNLNAVTSITINQTGGLWLNNNGATGGTGPNYTESSRINDGATLILNGAGSHSGLMNNVSYPMGLVHSSNTNSVHGELITNLNFNSGSNYVVLEANASSSSGTSNNAVLIRVTNSITRNNYSTLSVIGSNLAAASNSRTRLQMAESGSTTNSINFANQFRTGIYANGNTTAATSGQETHTGTTLSIVPWAIGQNITGTATAATLGNSFVHFEADVHGFRALKLNTEYASYSTANTHVNGHNVRESSTNDIDLTSVGGKRVNSLLINNQNDSEDAITITGSGTLTNTSGAFLFTGVGAVDSNGRANANATQGGITLTGFDGIEVASNHKEYNIFVTNTSTAGVTIESAFTTAESVLIKSGVGLLKLKGDNTAVDTVVINEGILEVSNRNNLGGDTGTLILAGGTLQLAKDWTAAQADLTGYNITALDGTISRINTNGNTGAAGTAAPNAALTLGPLGPGSGTIIKEGNGTLTLTGTTATQHTGDFYVYNTGNGSGIANGNIHQLVLNNSGGNAIGGNLYLGSPDADNALGGASVALSRSEQIADTAVITFYGNDRNNGNRAYFHLMGNNETVAGIVDTVGHGVLQNNGASPATLTVAGDGYYYFGGYLRNQGSSALAFTKSGSGTQILSGVQITYTGATTINDGVLVLRNTTSFASNITNNAELQLEQTSGTWTLARTISGSGTVRKTSNGTVTLNNSNSYSGHTLIEEGTLSLGASGSINNSASINIKSGATFDVTAKGSAGYTYNHTISGNGTIRGNLTLGSNGVLRPGASSEPSGASTTGDLLGSLTMTGANPVVFTLDGGKAQLQMAGATVNDAAGIISAYNAGGGAFTSYLSSKADEWNSALFHDNNGVPHHDYVDIQGEFIWNTGSTITYTALSSYQPTAGDVLNLWNWDILNGDYDLGTDASANYQRGGGLIGDLELPDIAGLIYDLSLFESRGIIVVVPEPSRAMLLLGGVMWVMLRRRRKR